MTLYDTGDSVWMLNSTVSSRLLKSMANMEGFQHEACSIINVNNTIVHI